MKHSLAELRVMAETALEAEASGDPRWAKLVERLQAHFMFRIPPRLMSEDEILAKIAQLT